MSVRPGAGLREEGGGQGAEAAVLSIPCRCGVPGRRQQQASLAGGGWGEVGSTGGAEDVTA